MKRVTQNEMVEWHYRINVDKSWKTLGDNEGQGSLACYSPWGGKESDTTEQLNKNHLESTVLGTGGGFKNKQDISHWS